MPGVVRVLTHETLGLADSIGVPCASNPPGSDLKQPKRDVLANGTVRHVGEPVAIVIASDRFAARDAADLVEIDYDPLPCVVDAEKALEPGAPRRCTSSSPTTSPARSRWRRTASTPRSPPRRGR